MSDGLIEVTLEEDHLCVRGGLWDNRRECLSSNERFYLMGSDGSLLWLHCRDGWQLFVKVLCHGEALSLAKSVGKDGSEPGVVRYNKPLQWLCIKSVEEGVLISQNAVGEMVEA